MVGQVQESSWETDIASLLSELSSVQTDLLQLLGEKRQMIADGDMEGLTLLQTREQEMIDRLQSCQELRGELLSRASNDGLPATNVRSLAAALPSANRGRLAKPLKEASARARLLEHQSLTNWVLVQRSLIHLSQVIEIIATGGKPKPTYGQHGSKESSGSLVDRAA